MKNLKKLSLEDEINREAEEIEKKVKENKEIEGMTVSEDMETALFNKIQEYEYDKRLKKVVYRKKKRTYVIGAIAAIIILICGSVMTSVGSKSYVNLKITSNSPDHESLKKLRVELEKIPGLAVVSTVPTDIEITSINAQKGSSLLDYAKKDGLKPEESIAIGDRENDYSMLSIPGIHSVAMENACDMIRNICVYQTRANTRDGIAYIINCILADRENFKL